MANLYYTFVLRFCQAGIDAALTLLAGVVIAGILRRMVGPAATRRLFGTGLRGAVRGWAAGMLLPVCSLGVIPVAREMRRAGVPGGVVLAFVLTGPLLNPISFLYGLTLGEPKVILSFVAVTLAKTAFVAYLWTDWFGGAADAALAVERGRLADAEPQPAAGAKRVGAVLVTAARELSGRDLMYYGLGLLGNAGLSVCLRHGAMQRTMAHHDHWAPFRMLWLSVPAYISPLSGMMRIGSMFEHGNSIGAAFILLVLGIGMSLGTLAWLGHDFGWRRFAPWFACYAALVLGLAYALEPVLWNPAKVEVDHTHAFDDLSSPFHAGYTPDRMREVVHLKLAQQFGAPERLATICLLSLLALGVLLRLVDRRRRLERWLVERPDAAAGGGWDRRLSGLALGLSAIAGLVAFSAIGAFVYYPDRVLCVEKMQSLVADTAATMREGQVEESIRYLEQWDLLARQMQVGVYLRHLSVTPDQARTVDDLREAIEVVRDDLRAGHLAEANRQFDHVVFHGEYRACLDAYAPPPGRPAGPAPTA